MKIRNICKGPRGLHTLNGSVLLDPGQEVETELSEAEHAVAYGTGWFEMPAPEGREKVGRQGS